jgi:hypothetical protein
MTVDESRMRANPHVRFDEGEGIVKQAWYAVFRHGRGNPDTRFAVTYTYSCPLSTLPADGTLAFRAFGRL